MLTPYEIATLRRQGRLDEAYNAAREVLNTQSDNTEALRLLGFILCDQLKQSATQSPERFLSQLKTFQEAHIPASETLIYTALLWNLRAFVADPVKLEDDLNHFLDSLFSLIRPMPIRLQTDAFSAFVGAVLHHASSWDKLGEFAYWAGFDYLQAKDFQPFTTADGKRLMSLAEQVDCKIGKYLLSADNLQQLTAFIPIQEQFVAQHRHYTYPPYYLAKMYIAVGQLAKAQTTLIPFMRKKAHDFWVWELMAETTEDTEMQLAFYAKALLCKIKEGMNIGLYQTAATAFARAGQYNMARYWVDQACRIRQAHHWPLTRPLLDMMRQPWYAAAKPILDRSLLTCYAAKAEAVFPTRCNPPAQYAFEGTLRLNPAGFGFVDDIFIPAPIVGTHRHGEAVKGFAVDSFDKKRNKPARKAVSLD